MKSTVTIWIVMLSTALALIGLGCSSQITGDESTSTSDEALKGGIPANDHGKGSGPKDAGDRDGDVDEDVDEGADEGDADGGSDEASDEDTDVDEDADEGADEGAAGAGGTGA